MEALVTDPSTYRARFFTSRLLPVLHAQHGDIIKARTIPDYVRRLDCAHFDLERSQMIARALVLATDQPRVGLELAHAAPRYAAGLAEYLIRGAASFRSAFTLYRRFARLMPDFARWDCAETERTYSNSVHCLFGVRLDPVMEDYALLRLASMTRDMMDDGAGSPIEVHFTYARPASERAYRDHFGPNVQLRFSQPHATLFWEASVLDRPLPNHDPQLEGFLVSHATHVLEQMKSARNFTSTLRGAVVRGLRKGEFALRDVAQPLHLSERTLRRRLAEEGTSYQEVLDEVRSALYEALCRCTPANAELTERLGFDSLAGLRRARTRWIARGLIAPSSGAGDPLG